MNVLDIYVGADIEIVALISDWKYVTLISIIHHLFAALTQPSQKLTRIISIHWSPRLCFVVSGGEKSVNSARNNSFPFNLIIAPFLLFLFSHSNKEAFSCQGILLAVNYFLLRGHTAITVFVPSWRKEQPRPDAQITGEAAPRTPPYMSHNPHNAHRFLWFLRYRLKCFPAGTQSALCLA